MSQRYGHKGLKNQAERSSLDEMVSFGAEPSNEISGQSPAPSQNVQDRIRQLLKKLQELNQRIDRLNDRF
jgi:hypothetical protein